VAVITSASSINVSAVGISSKTKPAQADGPGRVSSGFGYCRLDVPAEFAHPANRLRHPGFRGSKQKLLLSESTSRPTNAPDFTRIEGFILRRTTIAGIFSCWASANLRGLVCDMSRSRCGDAFRIGESPKGRRTFAPFPAGQYEPPRLRASSAHGAEKCPDLLEVFRIASWFHPPVLLNECRPVARRVPDTSAPPSIAALIP
jgi:hypothetical protein